MEKKFLISKFINQMGLADGAFAKSKAICSLNLYSELKYENECMCETPIMGKASDCCGHI